MQEGQGSFPALGQGGRGVFFTLQLFVQFKRGQNREAGGMGEHRKVWEGIHVLENFSPITTHLKRKGKESDGGGHQSSRIIAQQSNLKGEMQHHYRESHADPRL